MPSAVAASSLPATAESARPKRERRMRAAANALGGDDEREQDELPPVRGDLPGADAEGRDAGDAHIALGYRLPFDGDLIGDQADRQRAHGEVVAFQPERRETDDSRSQHGGGDTDDHGGQGAPAMGRGQQR